MPCHISGDILQLIVRLSREERRQIDSAWITSVTQSVISKIWSRCSTLDFPIRGLLAITKELPHPGRPILIGDDACFYVSLKSQVESPANGPLDRYVKLRVALAPGMRGTFSPTPLVSDLDLHPGTCVTHVPWCMPGSLTHGFLLSWWRGKRSRYSRRLRNG